MPGVDAPSAPPARSRRLAMSVDVEDYFQVWAFSGVISRSSWDGFAPRVGEATRRALDLFDRTGTKATFFALGWIAEREPGLIREIVARGHELASHGYDHAKVFDQSPERFRDDVARAKGILEDATGARVIGYRAPGFSIDARTPWAHQILGETGHLYSSSSHPIVHDHYGDPNAPRTPHQAAGLVEAPVATAGVFGRRISAAGGGWFRAAPYAASRRLIARAASQLNGPVIFYFHPWEIDPKQPRITGASVKSKLRHYLNLDAMEGKLERLLSDEALLAGASWGRLDAALGFTSRDERSAAA
ncbi:MAG: XrtA system polysaccharide deacetylase [Pseudomonadota bacterium]